MAKRISIDIHVIAISLVETASMLLGGSGEDFRHNFDCEFGRLGYSSRKSGRYNACRTFVLEVFLLSSACTNVHIEPCEQLERWGNVLKAHGYRICPTSKQIQNIDETRPTKW